MPNIQDTFLLRESRLELKMGGYSLINAEGTDYQYLHNHNFWQMNLCNFGTAELELKTYRMNVGAGDIVIFPAGTHHGFHYDKKQKFGCFSFKFGLQGIPAERNHPVIFLNDAEGRDHRRALIDAVSGLFYSSFPEALTRKQLEFMVPTNAPYAIIMEDFLFGILRRYLFSIAGKEKDDLLQKILDFVIQENGAPVSVSSLAEHLGYSAGHILYLVRQKTGKNTKQFIDEERIRIAKRFLHYSTFNITELAAHMGFSDIIYFCRFFKKYTGEPPGTYRRRVCSPAQLPEKSRE